MVLPFERRAVRFLRRLGFIGFSKKKNLFGVNPIFISTSYIFLTLLLAHLARTFVKKAFGDCLFKVLLLEFIATLELCASCFELIIVADNWGIEAYAIYLFSLSIWWASQWEEATACPYTAIEDVLEGNKDTTRAMLTILTQIVAALLTFSYVEVLWSMELVETHKGKADEDCIADLQVHMVVGALIEGVATCVCRLICRILAESNARFGNVLDAFFATMLVVAAFNYTGGYFNPALATSLKLGCEGNNFLEHMIVYWVGASLGAALSVFLFKSDPVQNYVERLKEKVE